MSENNAIMMKIFNIKSLSITMMIIEESIVLPPNNMTGKLQNQIPTTAYDFSTINLIPTLLYR